ncbi:asparagine synthase-related protein [Elongatibacter sediminis]|uniref:asparagine synthase (glutamine-hydrolyzing) n=1 Tax=Elongatibacter sediminis TaxID=3119006 RepID=A0AAW9R5J0_9GAMM
MHSILGILHFDGEALDSAAWHSLVGASAPHKWAAPEPARIPEFREWKNRSVALGYRPSPSARSKHEDVLPWVHDPTGHVITAEARLDNRRELMSRLNIRKKGGEEPHDGELILRAYLEWGRGCLDRLQGDFAFALWDPRRRALLCARDRLGAGALTYVRQHNRFALASSSEWLIRLPGLTGRPELTSLAESIDWRFPALGTRTTCRQEVQSMVPGELLEIDSEGRLSTSIWWALELTEPESYATEREAAEHFREVFSVAVQRRLEPGVDAGLLLSGGLDSMAIGATSRSLRPAPEPLHSFSGVYDSPDECIESRSIMSLVASLQTVPHLIHVPSLAGEPGRDDLIEIAWGQPHPVDNSLLLPALCCLAARSAGMDVMLYGAAGDIVTSAPHMYVADHFRNGDWRLAVSESFGASRNHVYFRSRSASWLLARFMMSAFLPEWCKRPIRKAPFYPARDPAPPPLMSRSLYDAYQEIKSESGPSGSNGERLPPEGSNWNHQASGLSGFGRIGRRFGTQMRDPWADVDVVKFFVGLPLKYKIRDGWTKYLVRRAFRDRVDKDVIWRRDKNHLGWRFTRELMIATAPFVRDTINGGLSDVADYVNVDEVNKLMQHYDPHDDNGPCQVVFDLVTLILWLKG